MANRGRKRGSRGDEDNGWEKWGGYMEAKKLKLQQQFNNSKSEEQTSKILSGVSIFVNGYTVPCAEDLKRLMSIHGGQYHHYYSKLRTTHIIATNLPDTKIKGLRDEKIVKPQWITDSIQNGSLLPCQPYQLYIQAPRCQATLNFARTDEKPNQCDDKTAATDQQDSESKDQKVVDEFQVLETWRSAAKKSPVNVIKSKPEVVMTKKETSSSKGGLNLLSEFYNNSRLHYISTVATKFKTYVSQLQKDLCSAGLPGRDRLREWLRREGKPRPLASIPKHDKVIMHIDMDCFFVSVGIRNRPELKGKPVAVTHSKGAPVRQSEGNCSEVRAYEASYYRGKHSKVKTEEEEDEEMVIDDSSDDEGCQRKVEPMKAGEFGSMSEVACCSYEARRLGVRNGMLVGEALKLCPQLHMIPYDFKGYEEVATALYDLVASYTLQMEAVSCDELFADCSDVLLDSGATPMEFATFLRQEVLSKTGCTCSIGIGHNMLLARLATKSAKPNGQFHLKPDDVPNFMSEQKIADLPGVGWALNLRIRTISSGISKCSELQKIPLKTLQDELGPKTGILLHNLCRGIDDRVVNADRERKSVSAEINYGIRFVKDDDATSLISDLAAEVCSRLRIVPAKGRTFTLKVKVRKKDAPVETAKFMGHGVCDNMARSITMKTACDEEQIIARECNSLLREMKVPVTDLRGVGIQVSRLELQKRTDNLQHDKSTLHQYFKPMQTETVSNVTTTHGDEEHFAEDKAKSKDSTGLWPSNLEDVDPSVLAVLPQDIRLQVEEEFKEENKPSHPKPIDVKSTEMPTTLSQIDPTVLGQLPKDIVDEIKSMYVKHNAPSSPAKSPTKGPKSEHSPQRNKKQQRAKKTPKKSSPDKMQVPYRHLTISQMFNRMESPTKTKIVKENDEDIAVKSSVEEIPETPQPPENKDNDAPNLMGRVELIDVRKLIGEWISEFDVPLEEDEQIFSEYLRRLIEEHDLERAHVVIRHTCRQLLLKKKRGWQSFYLEMVAQVQKSMYGSYGIRLDVPSLKF